MKALKCGFGFALVVGFAMPAACGGSSTSDSGNSSAGASAAGQSATTAGEGSTTAGMGSTTAGAPSGGGGDTTAGDASVGGGGATGGSAPDSGGASTTAGQGGGNGGNRGGSGGMTMNPVGCPSDGPTNFASCTPLANPQTTCDYATENCRCGRPVGAGNPGPGQAGAGGMSSGGSGGASDVWRCTPKCPTEPIAGDACSQGELCAGSNCTCDNLKWRCFGGGMGGAGGGANACPTTKPAAGDACMTNRPCTYGNTGCACRQQKWVCN